MPCVTQLPLALCMSAEACLLGNGLTGVSIPEARSSSCLSLFKPRTIYTQAQCLGGRAEAGNRPHSISWAPYTLSLEATPLQRLFSMMLFMKPSFSAYSVNIPATCHLDKKALCKAPSLTVYTASELMKKCFSRCLVCQVCSHRTGSREVLTR